VSYILGIENIIISGRLETASKRTNNMRSVCDRDEVGVCECDRDEVGVCNERSDAHDGVGIRE